jgi:2-octaprenyl-6-methoxyphenol hydroxylase
MQSVAVLGLGLNGLIAGILSAKLGLKTTIFEGGSLESYKNDTRTSVLTFESIEFLAELGLKEGLTPFLSPIFHIYTFEGVQKSPILSFDAPEISPNPFGYVVHNFDLKAFLLKEIARLGVEIVNKSVKYAENGEVELEDGTKNRFKLVLNCLGKGSSKMKFNVDYKQTAFVFNISHTQEHKNIAVESFAPQGPLAVLPLQNPLQSGVIWTVQEPSADFLKNASHEVFLAYFKEAMARMGHIGQVVEVLGGIRSYPLSISLAKNQALPRTLLLGDCFNSIHPVAGSSFNMSVKDMKNLHNYLKKSLSLGLDIGGLTELERFAKGNLRHHIEMNLITHSLIRLFSNSNPLLKAVRNAGLEAVETLSPIKKFFMKRASGL